MVKRFVICLFFLLLLTACGGEESGTPEPIDEDVDVCELCYMSVFDNQFAAQIVTEDGKALKFDDIGCLAAYIVDNEQEGTPYVRDFDTLEWVHVDEALFVFGEEIETPMNSGLASFANKESMDQFLSENAGSEWSWEEVLESGKGSGIDEHELSHD